MSPWDTPLQRQYCRRAFHQRSQASESARQLSQEQRFNATASEHELNRTCFFGVDIGVIENYVFTQSAVFGTTTTKAFHEKKVFKRLFHSVLLRLAFRCTFCASSFLLQVLWVIFYCTFCTHFYVHVLWTRLFANVFLLFSSFPVSLWGGTYVALASSTTF